MSLPKMTTAVDNISKLDTRPNAVNGLTADELKAKFDKAPEDIKRFLNEVLIPALDGAITPDALGAVPETRRVNGKTLAADITISAEDIPALAPDLSKKTAQYLLDELADGVSKAVPKTRKVNGKTLDADVTLDAASIDYAGAISGAANVKAALDAFAANLSGLTAEDVQYQGNIGAAQAFTVAGALDGLAIGVPLDMSSDYAASGAASVQAWATAAATGNATEYRVAAGRYQINLSSGIAYNVVITNVPDDMSRIVQITECNIDPFVYFDVYSVTFPGEAPVELVYFSTEERLFSVYGMNVILPSYGAGDKGKVLTVDDSGNPKWKAAAALPTVGAADNGKFLRVVSGAWAAQALTNVAEVGA